MRHVAYALAVALLLAIPFAASVSAETILEGRLFGQHVSDMAPLHPRTHGQLFGECVMEMALTGECSHHEGM